MKKLFAALLVLSMLLTSATALAEWPERPIELIVPANPGGDTDANARALAAALQEELGWTVNVTNMNGGSGGMAFQDLLDNPDDGYRFVFYHNGGITAELFGFYDFSIAGDFQLVGMPFLDNSNAFLSSSKNTNFTDTASLVAYMKEHPGQVTFATETGNFTHVQALAFQEAVGADFKIVDAGTASEKIVALLDNRLDIIATQAGLVRDYLDTGDFICLGLLSDSHLDGAPELPTFVDAGYDVVMSKFFYLAAPKTMSAEDVATLNAGLAKVVDNAALNEYATSALVEVTSMTPDETVAYYADQYSFYEELLRNQGFID